MRSQRRISAGRTARVAREAIGRPRLWPVIGIAVATLACAESLTSPAEHVGLAELADLIVTPVTPVPPGGAPAASPRSTAYVSLPPGTLPDVRTVRIRNLTTGESTDAITIVDGGFDPIPIPAIEGQELEVLLSYLDNSVGSVRVRVPARRPPVVVRTSPPRGRTDVALSVRPTIVFSEPIDSNRLTSESVKLITGGTRVGGSPQASAAGPWAVEFAPADALAPATAYELVIGEVHDLEGMALETPMTVSFTTLARPAGTGIVKVSSVATGGAFDADGFVVQLDGAGAQATDLNQEIVIAGVPAGTHVLRLDGLAPNCSAADGPTWSVAVSEGSTTSVELSISCVAPPDLSSVRIVFARAPHRNPHTLGSTIVAMNADGSGRVELTNGEFVDYGPDVSPDGRRIVFQRGLRGPPYFSPDLYLMSADGTGMIRLFGGPAYGPDWAPDGRRIVFTAGGGLWGGAVHVLDVDAGAIVMKGDSVFPGGEDAWAAWSPDGTRIAFTRQRWPARSDGPVWWYEASIGIWTMSADGTDIALVREGGPWGPSQPVWSSDGARIAFQRGHASGGSLIATMNSDGTSVTTVLESDAWLGLNDWSADGSLMLVTTEVDIYLLRVADGAMTRLTANEGHSRTPAFWPAAALELP